MVNWVAKKSRSRFDDFVNQIQAHNAELGLDRSVEEKKIALDYLLPLQEENIEQYVERNNFSKRVYIEKLHQKVGKPVPLIAYLLVFGITLIYGFAGPLLYEITGLTYLAEYLIGFLVLLLVSLVGYFLL
jgi:hypothetical protein